MRRIALLAMLLGACGASGSRPGSAPDMGAAQSRECFGSNDCAPGEQCNPFGQCVPDQSPPVEGDDAGTGLPSPPPEVKMHVEVPASGKRFVYVAIQSQDTVVKIDSMAGGTPVRTIPVGHFPTSLHTVPGQDVALVLNAGAGTATLLRSKDDGSDDVLTLPTAAGLNTLTMSPDGRYGIAFFDLEASGGQLAPKQTFQEVTLFDVEGGKEKAVNLSVGFKPSEVQYAPDGSAAWIVTEEGLSIVSLASTPKPEIVPTVPLRKDPLAEAPPTRVVVTSDGKRALALVPKLQGFRAVQLDNGAITDTPLPGEPTDLVLSPDGKLAVVVLRAESLVAFADLPGAIGDGTKVQKASTGMYTAGQAVMTADGAHAVVYTNAIDQKVLIVADLKARTLKPWPIKKGVRSVLTSPDGKVAVVLHNKTPGTPSPNDSLDDYLDKLEAYSLFEIGTGYAKLQPTDAPPGDVAFAPDSGSAYLLLSDGANVRSVEALDLGTFLVTSVGLGSPPVAVGVVPTTKQVYVAQDHPLGRMTFVDTTDFSTRTLTGFALNGGIIE